MKKLIFTSLILFLSFSTFASNEDSLVSTTSSTQILRMGHDFVRVSYNHTGEGNIYIKVSDSKNNIVHRDYLNYKGLVRRTYSTSKLPHGLYKVEILKKGELLSKKNFTITKNKCWEQMSY